MLKHIARYTYKPIVEIYLSKPRRYRYMDTRLEIAPQVFHPGFFFSTKFLLKYINRMPLQKKRFLELGCGSGLISIVASKKGASVVATDINPVAVEMLKKNCILNAANLEIIESDLFQHIPEQQFDIIAINPPYYKKTPVTNADHAWFCGENGEYFATLFADITGYMHSTTEILMVLFEGCDMQMIKDHAAKNNFVLHNVCCKQNLLEKTFIYKIEMVI